MWETDLHTHVYFNEFFTLETGRQKILNWIVVSFRRISSALDFFMDVVFICYCSSYIFKVMC
jgi:hypothetical protein